MDERDIELFQDLMTTKNITKTAQNLFMTQSAVTKRLHKLEGELGVPLFLRTVKGLIATPSADGIVKEMGQLQASLLKIRSQSQYDAGHLTGTLKIGVSVNYARYVLPPILKQYMTDFPDVKIEVTTGQSLDLYQKLQNHQLFLAVIRGSFPWEEETRLISQEQVYAVTSKENEGIPFSQLPYIYRRSDKPFIERIQRWKAENKIQETASRIQVNDIAACLAMVSCGIGWSILPEICLKDQKDLLLTPLAFRDGTPFIRRTFVLYQDEYATLPQVKIFLERLGDRK